MSSLREKLRFWLKNLVPPNKDIAPAKHRDQAPPAAPERAGSSSTTIQEESGDSAESASSPQPSVAAPVPQAPPQAAQPAQADKPPSKSMVLDTAAFFAEYGEANRYSIREVIGKGSYGIVCSAVDNFTGQKVAIKKITNVFEHVSDATRILREIKLLRLLKHPDIVEIKHIMLPPSARDFKDIYVVFELMETDLHQVIKANDDLTPEHHQFFLYQMLRGLKYIHSAKVFHRDLKPKNILANSDCKLKICDFGLARPAFNDMPTTIFWTDYVATRWYRAPELCGSFYAKYSPAIDIWSVGCIFAEVLLGKPLFPGRNVVHQLELITDLLGTPPPEVIAKVRNEKARRFLAAMRKKPGVPFEQFFPRADRGALALMRRLLAFDPADRPTAEEALADPYFIGLHSVAREPTAAAISKAAFEFDRRKLTMDDVRELIYLEVLEYHREVRLQYIGLAQKSAYLNPSALDNFKRQFMHLEANPGAVLDVRSSVSNPNYRNNWPGASAFGSSAAAEVAAGALATASQGETTEERQKQQTSESAAQQRRVGGRYLQSQQSAPMPRLDPDEVAALNALAEEKPRNKSHHRAAPKQSVPQVPDASREASAKAPPPQQRASAAGNLQGAAGNYKPQEPYHSLGHEELAESGTRVSASGSAVLVPGGDIPSTELAPSMLSGPHSGSGAAAPGAGNPMVAVPLEKNDSSSSTSSTSINPRLFSPCSSAASTTATVALAASADTVVAAPTKHVVPPPANAAAKHAAAMWGEAPILGRSESAT